MDASENPADVLAELLASNPDVSPERLGEMRRYLSEPAESDATTVFDDVTLKAKVKEFGEALDLVPVAELDRPRYTVSAYRLEAFAREMVLEAFARAQTAVCDCFSGQSGPHTPYCPASKIEPLITPLFTPGSPR